MEQDKKEDDATIDDESETVLEMNKYVHVWRYDYTTLKLKLKLNKGINLSKLFNR